MGTDIHLAVERRNSSGQWERVLPPADYKQSAWVEEYHAEKGIPFDEYDRKQWYNDRNYRLFAILANIRNGYGFAGVPIWKAIQPIAKPRGLPLDMSPEVQKLASDDEYNENDISLGDHSFSWLTLAELQAYPWNQGGLTYGAVDYVQFAERILKHGRSYPLKLESAPYEAWSAAVTGATVVNLSFDQALDILDKRMAIPLDKTYVVRDAWETPLASQTKDWNERVMPALAKLGPPDDVRIVFGFDS